MLDYSEIIESSGIKVPFVPAIITPKIERPMRNNRYEGGECAALRRILRPGDRALELGAGVGLLSTVAGLVEGVESVTTIEANPDLKQSELARATHLDRSTVVTVIDNLERRGLVERRVALHDRRSNAIRLTEAGGALLKKLKRQVMAHEKRLMENFSADERETFIRLLQKVFPENR